MSLKAGYAPYDLYSEFTCFASIFELVAMNWPYLGFLFACIVSMHGFI